jgi:hypothetical protein
MLKNASTVFDAMFSPKFTEGKSLQRSGATPATVELPEDDAESMAAIFRVIHGRHDGLPVSMTFHQLVVLALAAEKYDCASCLFFAAEHWFNDFDAAKIRDANRLWELMVAAYLLDVPKAFSAFSLAVIFNHSDSFVTLAEQFKHADVDSRLCRTSICLLTPAHLLTMSQCSWRNGERQFGSRSWRSSSQRSLPFPRTTTRCSLKIRQT